MSCIPRLSLITIISIFCISCASVPLEATYVPADSKGWVVGNSKDVPGRVNIIEYVKSPETIHNWTKLISIQFLEGSKSSPKSIMSKLKARMENRCADVKWEIIKEERYSVLYEWSIKNCNGFNDQYEIAKLMKGNDGIHRAAYTEKVKAIDPAVRKLWVKWLMEAYVQKAGNRVVVK